MIPAQSNTNLAQLRLMRDAFIEKVTVENPEDLELLEDVAAQNDKRDQSEFRLKRRHWDEEFGWDYDWEDFNNFVAICKRIAFLERETIKQLKEQARV